MQTNFLFRWVKLCFLHDQTFTNSPFVMQGKRRAHLLLMQRRKVLGEASSTGCAPEVVLRCWKQPNTTAPQFSGTLGASTPDPTRSVALPTCDSHIDALIRNCLPRVAHVSPRTTVRTRLKLFSVHLNSVQINSCSAKPVKASLILLVRDLCWPEPAPYVLIICLMKPEAIHAASMLTGVCRVDHL